MKQRGFISRVIIYSFVLSLIVIVSLIVWQRSPHKIDHNAISSPEKLASLKERAISKNDSNAACFVGVYYLTKEHDENTSKYWLEFSAHLGNKHAQEILLQISGSSNHVASPKL